MNELELLKTIDELTLENEQLKKKQVIEKTKTKIKVIDRCYELNVLDRQLCKKLLQKKYQKIGDNYYSIQNVKGLIIISNMIKISKELTKILAINNNGKKPNVDQIDRTNIYTINDFELYGDKIIISYFNKHPFETWFTDNTLKYYIIESKKI